LGGFFFGGFEGGEEGGDEGGLFSEVRRGGRVIVRLPSLMARRSAS